MAVQCSREDTRGASRVEFVEAIPRSGSVIQPYTHIIVKFDKPPLGLSCYTCIIEDGTVSETVDISHTGKFSQSGEIITITGPFKSDRLLTIRLEWGIGDSEPPSSPLSKSEVTLEYTVVPEWTDGVITITAGRFKDRSKLQALFRNAGWKSSNPHFEGFADEEVTLPVFPMAQQTYTVDIAIVPVSEVGIEKSATIETIREQYLEYGYRPLTLEEMYELRLQLADQSEDSCVEESTSAFHVLLSGDDIYSFSRDDDTVHDIDRLYSIPILVGPRRGLWDNNTSAGIHSAPCRLSAQLRLPAPPEPLTGHAHAVNSVSFSPDGQMLASGGKGQAHLWEVDTGSLIRTFKGHTDGVESVSFSPDGQMLASGSMDKTIRLWDVNTGSLIRTFKGHTDGVKSVSFSPDGQMLASGSNDRTTRLWDPKINYSDYSGSSEVGFFGHIYVNRMKSLTNADDDGWVLISPYSDKYFEYITSDRACATRFACVRTEKRN